MRRVTLAVAAALALALVGCGGDDSDTEESASQDTAPAQEAKPGGDLTMLYAADVDTIDPGQTYYQYGFVVAYATQRPLYSFKPDDASNPEPDLAEGAPEIADVILRRNLGCLTLCRTGPDVARRDALLGVTA